jgi:hypothetical protein
VSQVTVKLDLQDGFIDDEVVVKLDGREIQRVTNVSTRSQIGLARSMDLVLPPTAVQLSIELPQMDLRTGVNVPAKRPLWIGASLNDTRDRLDVTVSERRFGYM